MSSRRIRQVLLLSYGAAIFASALLMFWMEPLFTKSLLPAVGGAPHVWNVALMFFQLTLLLGYCYVYWIDRWLSYRTQVLGQILLFCAAGVALPVLAPASWRPSPEASITASLLGLMTTGIGPLFFMLATTSPLLQKWFSHLDHPAADDPYFLYATSNAGSLIALLGFPFVLSPLFSLEQQNSLWAAGYGLLGAAMLGCGWLFWKHGAALEKPKPVSEDSASPSWTDRLLWVALSAIPASLLHGTTSYLTTDVAAVPLLWVVPLALYLLTFMLAFGQRTWVSLSRLQSWSPGFIVALLVFFPFGGFFAGLSLPLFLVGTFILTWALHQQLAELRPDTSFLPEFYVWLAAGGALGGSFNALIAPLIFDNLYELPIAIALSAVLFFFPIDEIDLTWKKAWAFGVALAGCLLWPALAPTLPLPPLGVFAAALSVLGVVIYSSRHQQTVFSLGVAGLLVFLIAAPQLFPLTAHATLKQDRNFYGLLKAQRSSRQDTVIHTLISGTTLHGKEVIQPPEARTAPLSYYHGGIASLFEELSAVESDDPQKIGLAGLGAGTMLCYQRPGQSWTVFEINPMVVRWARDTTLFHFIEQCPPTGGIQLGDARLLLRDNPKNKFDLLVLDAFTSDAVPVHLLTREALQLYKSRLTSQGFLLFHVSNRYLALAPIIARGAHTIGGEAYKINLQPDPDDQLASYRNASLWVAVVFTPRWAKRLEELSWKPVPSSPDRPWTDSYSNLLEAFSWSVD